MLDGEYGPAKATAMKLLVTIGDVFEASRLVGIKSAQVSGVSYKNVGDAGLHFIQKLRDMGAEVSVPTTLNPAGMDLLRWKEIGFERSFAKKQLRIANAFEKMKIIPTYTCTPYLVGNCPARGEHIAWAESSAIAYANSVIGARTNREGGPTSLACAITGKTPLFGLHMEDGRTPSHVVDVEFKISKPIEYSLLGYTIGKIGGLKIPFIRGEFHPSTDELKALAAALGASGAIPMFHMEDFTPESGDASKHLNECEGLEVEKRDIKQTLEELTTNGEADFVCIGCPHCSISELKSISKILRGKKVSKELWIFTSRHNREVAEKKGYLDEIEGAGGKVISDTCMVVSPLEGFGFTSVMTNSCKAAHYLPSTCGLKTNLLELRQCIDSAVIH